MAEDNERWRSLIFLHIPKTAGTTLHRIIERNYPAPAVHSFGPDAHESVRRFKALDRQQRAEIRLLKGHMPFGLHSYLEPPVAYFTVLREPAARVTSYYYYILRTPQHYLYDFVTSRRLSLQQLLDSEEPLMMDNGQVRLLSGVWGEAGFGQVTTADLARATDRLEQQFAVVGTMARFDETILLLAESFGWRHIYYQRENVGPRRPLLADLPLATRERIEEVNQLDAALYNTGRSMLEREIQRRGAAFAAAVGRYRLANRLSALHARYPVYQELRRHSLRMFLRRHLAPRRPGDPTGDQTREE